MKQQIFWFCSFLIANICSGRPYLVIPLEDEADSVEPETDSIESDLIPALRESLVYRPPDFDIDPPYYMPADEGEDDPPEMFEEPVMGRKRAQDFFYRPRRGSYKRTLRDRNCFFSPVQCLVIAQTLKRSQEGGLLSLAAPPQDPLDLVDPPALALMPSGPGAPMISPVYLEYSSDEKF